MNSIRPSVNPVPATARSRWSLLEEHETPPPARSQKVSLLILAGVLAVSIPVFWVFNLRHTQPRTLPLPADEVQVEAIPQDHRGDRTPLGTAPVVTKSMEEQWGIQITGMRLALGGNALDMRYKVVDAGKATNFLYLNDQTYVVDQDSGKVLLLPFQRESQTSQKLVAGKTYFALLSNKGHLVKSGSKVAVVIGDARVRDVTVD